MSLFEFIINFKLFLLGTRTSKAPFWRTRTGQMFWVFEPIFLSLDGLCTVIFDQTFEFRDH